MLQKQVCRINFSKLESYHHSEFPRMFYDSAILVSTILFFLFECLGMEN